VTKDPRPYFLEIRAVRVLGKTGALQQDGAPLVSQAVKYCMEATRCVSLE